MAALHAGEVDAVTKAPAYAGELPWARAPHNHAVMAAVCGPLRTRLERQRDVARSELLYRWRHERTALLRERAIRVERLREAARKLEVAPALPTDASPAAVAGQTFLLHRRAQQLEQLAAQDLADLHEAGLVALAEAAIDDAPVVHGPLDSDGSSQSAWQGMAFDGSASSCGSAAASTSQLERQRRQLREALEARQDRDESDAASVSQGEGEGPMDLTGDGDETGTPAPVVPAASFKVASLSGGVEYVILPHELQALQCKRQDSVDAWLHDSVMDAYGMRIQVRACRSLASPS